MVALGPLSADTDIQLTEKLLVHICTYLYNENLKRNFSKLLANGSHTSRSISLSCFNKKNRWAMRDNKKRYRLGDRN